MSDDFLGIDWEQRRQILKQEGLAGHDFQVPLCHNAGPDNWRETMSDDIIKRGHEGLAGHDPSAPPQGILRYGGSIDRHERWKTIASFSAEATANFFGGGDIGKPDIKDPATAARLDRQYANLRRAIHERVVPSLAVALERDSAQTAHRLRQLSQASYGGDAVASGLLAILLGELLNWGLKE